jgi:hypothetical protein
MANPTSSIDTFFSTVTITKVNNDSTPNNSSITSTNITIEGTAKGTKTTETTIESDDLPTEVITEQDVTSQVQTFIQFGNPSTIASSNPTISSISTKAIGQPTIGQPSLHPVTSTDGGKTWSLTLPVPLGSADANGDLRITAIAKIAQQQSTNSVTVKVDNTPPALIIVKPIPDETITRSGSTVSVTLEVTATDNRQVAEVKWSLNNRTYNNTTLLDAATGKRTADVAITALGQQTIFVRAKDAANNVTEKSVTVDVATEASPADPEDITGAISYLGDLLDFAAKRIKISSSSAPTTERALPAATEIAKFFCQRFDELVNPQNRSVALQRVHQIRIGVDVLRKYLLSRNPSSQTTLDGFEKAYRQQAYDALLSYLGISYPKLRMALTGDSKARTAMANRLGIGTEALQELFLAQDQISELGLEKIFGLADTHSIRDPFATNTTPPKLLSHRRNYLRALWRQQDTAEFHPTLDIPIPIIDPDIVQKEDLISGTAIELLNNRLQEVEILLNQLKNSQPRQVDAIAHFESILKIALKGTTRLDLSKLFESDTAGNNIEPQLKAMFLERSPFLYLKHFDQLLKSNVVIATEEWEQVYAILVQVQKLRDTYSVWREQEVNKSLALGPDDFALQSATSVALSLWRATQSVRQAWETRLTARIEQDRALLQELKSIVDSAEAIALPTLRNILISQIKKAVSPTNIGDVSEQLTAELFIDFKSSAEQKITRIEQALESLQGVLFALRMGNLASSPVLLQNPASSWRIDKSSNYTDSKFDEEWQWMGSHATWRAAMGVFIFPENFLQPTTRLLPLTTPTDTPPPHLQTQDFKDLADRLRSKTHLTRKIAFQEANAYLADLKTHIDAANQQLGSFSLQEPTSIERIDVLRIQIDTVFMAISPSASKFHDVPNWTQEVFYFVPLLLAQHLERSGEYLAALDWYKAVYAYTLPTNRKVYKGLSLEEDDSNNFTKTDDWLLADFNPHKIVQTRKNAYTRFTIASLARCLLTFADDQFTKETAESIPQARSLYLTAVDLLNLPEMLAPSKLGTTELNNILLESIRNHASINLLKLRSGLNIAGLKRSVPTDANAQIIARQPTPYRYQVLIERAKQLAATAGQIESSFLSALEKRDSELYALIQAQQDITLSQSQIQLQGLRVNEAQDGVQLAELQRDRSQIQVTYFEDLLVEGYLLSEQVALVATATAGAAGILAGIGTALTKDGLIAGIGQAISAGASATASISSTIASFERREQEWNQQLSLSRQDVLIGNQQIELAQDQVAISLQELRIAAIQADHAIENLTFLSTKFTNAELFDWMSRVLERIYAFFLQQATTIARLAEAQLSFERQETLPAFIQSDYWQAPEEGGFGSSDQQSDRRGLTGSARLLQAITELDQYAFTSDRRKLQLTKTLSLAALSPAEFQRFQETGVMIFATPMEMFDRDFPGHHLRLIERVRTSVIALIPPSQGIRATLSTTGISRVVINSNATSNDFQKVFINHGPQSVALSSPINATGLFELDEQPEMLLPFEKIGVDTLWELQMPKAANLFDYRTIADVLITIEYTALNSVGYRQQVIQSLPQDLSADRAFSLRNQFPDQWYDLHNPDQTSTPLTVKFNTLREDFPANLDELSIQQVVMYFARSSKAEFDAVEVKSFNFKEEGSAGKLGGAATSTDDIISTRRVNASKWLPMIEKSPFGEWELSFPDTAQMREIFSQEQFEDILFVITYQGRSPAWPA